MTTFLNTIPIQNIKEVLQVEAQTILLMPDNFLRDLAIQQLCIRARRYGLDALNLLKNQPKTQPPAAKQLEATYTCPNCNRPFKSQQALKGHRPHKCNGT